MTTTQCHYRGPNDERCEDTIESNNTCYWHERSQVKNEPDLVERLEKRARTGVPMIGFELRKANLRGIDLVNHKDNKSYQLIHSDLYRCDLREAHIYNIDLTGSSLMKANLEHANLNSSKLKNTNLLGTQLLYTKMDNIHWNEKILQESQADRTLDKNEKLDLYEQSEEVYRNLRRATEEQGLFQLTGLFFQREMVMRRKQLPRYSSKRALSKMVELFCGYGEDPLRVVTFSLITIFCFALIYFLLGISHGDEIIQFLSTSTLIENAFNFFNSLYFSVVTFTTLGYGDLSPHGWTRAFAAVEAFVGSFSLALFVVVFVKKMTR